MTSFSLKHTRPEMNGKVVKICVRFSLPSILKILKNKVHKVHMCDRVKSALVFEIAQKFDITYLMMEVFLNSDLGNLAHLLTKQNISQTKYK